jgi:hypothetical protein
MGCQQGARGQADAKLARWQVGQWARACLLPPVACYARG